MKPKPISLPEIGLIAGTRAVLGVGVGFLLSDKLKKEQRKRAGWVLVGIGALTTVPLMMDVLGKRPPNVFRFLTRAFA